VAQTSARNGFSVTRGGGEKDGEAGASTAARAKGDKAKEATGLAVDTRHISKSGKESFVKVAKFLVKKNVNNQARLIALG
jgi:hypothetical protein